MTDTRDIAAAAFTPCQRRKALAMHGADPYVVAERLYGAAKPGHSNIAFRVGNRFEADLLHGPSANPAARLRGLYERAGILDANATAKSLAGAGPGAFARVAADRAAGRPHPTVLLKTRIPFRVADTLTHVEPDVIVADGTTGWRLGEIKVYVDRDGHTSDHNIASTCRQLAVGVIAVRAELAAHNIDVDVAPVGDVIFRRPGPNRASLHSLPLHAELAAVTATLDDADAFLKAFPTIATRAQIDDIPATRGDHCATTCGLAAVCGDTQSPYRHLGGTAHQQLDAAGIPAPRAAQLAAGAAPLNDVEAAAAKWLRQGWGQ